MNNTEYEWYCKNCECTYKEPAEVIYFNNEPEYFCTCGSGEIYRRKVKVVPKSRLATGKFIKIQNEIIKRYKVKAYNYCPMGYRTRTHAHVKECIVCKWDQKNSFEATFTLLHEIGHIETTTSKMRRAESEYYATVWAIEQCKKYKLDIPQKTIDSYQNYIDMEIDRGIRRGGKGYGELTLTAT